MKNITRYIIPVLIFLVVFSVYLRTSGPTINSGDTAELSGAGATLGIAHSPGYPLYVITNKIFVSLIPWGNPAYRTNLYSSICAALTSVLIYFICILILPIKPVDDSTRLLPIICATVTCFIYSFTPPIWKSALVSEVFALNNLFVAILCLIFALSLYGFIPSELSKRVIYVSGLVFGLGLGNQHTLILITPGLIFASYLILVQNNHNINLTSSKIKEFAIILPITTLFLILGLFIYWYLPLRSIQQPVYDWEDPETFTRFWNVFFRSRYGSLQIAQGTPQPLTLNLITTLIYSYLKLILEFLTPVNAIFIFIGTSAPLILNKFNKLRLFVIFNLLLFIFTGPAFFVLARLNLTSETKFILERFLGLSLLPATVLISLGLGTLLILFIRVFNFFHTRGLTNIYLNTVYLTLLLLVLFYIPFRFVVTNLNLLNQRDNFTFYDYGKNVLHSVPVNTILLADRADELEFVLSYLQYAIKVRPDVEFIDCNAGVSRSIYGDDYYNIWGAPRLRRRELKEMEIITRRNRPVYYATFLPQQTDIPKHNAGLVYRADSGTSTFNFVAEPVMWDELFGLRIPKNSDDRTFGFSLSYFNLLANYYLSVNLPDFAKIMAQKIELMSGRIEARLNLAYWYFQHHKFSEAIREYELMYKSSSVYQDQVATNLGAVYDKTGDTNRAISWYQTAIQNNPESVLAHYNLSVVYWRLGNWKEVVRELETVLKLDPNHHEANKYLAIARRNFGD